MSATTEVTVFTDGSCIGNPGPGGYAAILIAGGRRREIIGGFRLTTNSRMEILAAVAALEALKWPCRVTVRSDARYLVDGVVLGRAREWREAGWMRGPEEAVPNADLWERLLTLCEKHAVEFVWVRGHAGHLGNERCDRLALEAARAEGLPADTGYEAQQRAIQRPSTSGTSRGQQASELHPLPDRPLMAPNAPP